MHNNYYFLRRLSKSLEVVLTGTVISECFSQNKDELIIRFETSTVPFFIRASLDPSFACLSFPHDFHRARKNSVDLFDLLIGQRVSSIRQFDNERSFSLNLSNDVTLLFKMHGNRSNIILFEKNTVVALFKNNMLADETLKIDSLDRFINWDYEYFVEHQQKLESTYFTFGKFVWSYLNEQDFDNQPIAKKWEMLQLVKKQFEDPAYYLTTIDYRLRFLLLPQGNVVTEFQDPIKALNDFFHSYTLQSAFAREKSTALNALKSKLQSSESYYQKAFEKLTEVESDTNYKTWADLIMAHMHLIKVGTDKVSLPDFYTENHMVEIKLKKDQSPQKNAEAFYRKAKNQHIEVNRLQKALEIKEVEIEKLKNEIKALDAAENLKIVRSQVGANDLFQSKEKQPAPLPFHQFEFKGYKILVGRNAQSNDVLTLKFGYKEDLWLHAKDVAGSHVLIKHQAGKKFPKEVIERAAQLAAYNSKRKTETLCPVIVTPRKYVRKRKGDPAGAVVVEREEIIMVEPRLEGLS